MIFFVIMVILLCSSFSSPWGMPMYARPYYRRRPMFGPMYRGPMHHHHHHRPMHHHGPMGPGPRHF